jgi:hypothetical protein
MTAMSDTDRLPNFMTAEELNPPDVDPMGLLNRGYGPVEFGVLSEYIDVMHRTVGSSRAFHELGALCMAGAALQQRFLPVTWAQRRKLRPNLFGCILGRSSFDHKSTALSKVGETMPWEAMPNCARLPGFFTEEGLYKELNANPMGLIVRDEIGVLFASRNRKYTEFVVPFLTDAFGGWMNAKRLSSQSYTAKEVALTILGATTYTEFAETTTDRDWNSGWLVRWLFAVPDADYDPSIDPAWATEADERALVRVQKRLAALSALPATPMQLAPGAEDVMKDWRRALIQHAMNSDERHERVDAIIERYATYAWKFSMILCAVTGDAETVTRVHTEAAVRLAENYMMNVFNVYQYQQAHRLTGSLMQKAIALLNKEGAMNGRDLGRALHIDATMRNELLERLRAVGAIAEEERGRTTFISSIVNKLPTARLDITR